MACIVGRPNVFGAAPSHPLLPGRPRWRARQAHEARAVIDALKSLSDRYLVFCSYPVPAGDGSGACPAVDYLVVGPTGLFAISAAEHAVNVVEPSHRNASVRRELAGVLQCTAELTQALADWSGGTLSDIAVTPVLAYTHMGAYVVSPREGDARVIPVKWLRSEILDERKNAVIGPQTAWRIARMLFLSLAEDTRAEHEPALLRCGEVLEELMRTAMMPPGPETLGFEQA